MAVGLSQGERGEVRIETGTGLVDEVKQKPGARNAQVLMTATHHKFDAPVSGWVDTFDSSTWPIVQAAARERFEVEYRIEVHRKDDVAPDKAIAELGNRQKVRDLVAIARKGELSGIDRVPASDADTRPPVTVVADDGAELDAHRPDPADGDPEAGWLAKAQREATEARHELGVNGNGHVTTAEAVGSKGPYCAPCSFTAADTKAMLEHTRTDDHRAALAGTPAAQAPAQAPPSPPSSPHADRERPVPPRRGVKVAEARRWKLLNSDGSPNLNSFAYGAVVDFLELAHYLVGERQAVEAPDEPANLRAVEALARTLLEAADRVQANTRVDGRHDRMDGSHYQARGAVRTALKVLPVPFGSTAEVRAAWLDELVAHASALAGIALDIFREHEGITQ